MTTQKIGKIILDDTGLAAERTITFQDSDGQMAKQADLSSHTESTTAHGAAGANVGTTNTQTLENKTIKTLTACDATDPTKKVTLDASLVTPGTTRTLKSQDRNGTAAVLQDVQDSSINAGYEFRGNASEYITIPNNLNLVFNNGVTDFPFSILWQGRRDLLPTSNEVFLAKSDVTGSGNLFRDWELKSSQTGGNIDFACLNTDGATRYIRAFTANGVMEEKISACIIGTYDGSASHTGLKIFKNGILQSSTNSNTNSYVGMTSTSISPVYIGKLGSSSAFFNTGVTNRSIVFNYDISAYPEKIRRYYAGAKLDYEDIGGSMADKTDGLSWTNVSFNTQTISGKQISNLSGGIYDRADIIGIGPIIAGKIYRVYFTNASSTPASVLALSLLTAAQDEASAYYPITVAAGYIDLLCMVSDSNGRLLLQARYDNISAGQITIVSMIQLGAVLDLEPEGISKETIDGAVSNKWYDSSGNGLNGTATGAIPANPLSEYIDDIGAGSVALTNNTYASDASVALAPGDWEIVATAEFTHNSSTGVTGYEVAISTDSGTGSTGIIDPQNVTRIELPTHDNPSIVTNISTKIWKASPSTTTTYYAKGKSWFTSTADSVRLKGSIFARRIK